MFRGGTGVVLLIACLAVPAQAEEPPRRDVYTVWPWLDGTVIVAGGLASVIPLALSNQLVAARCPCNVNELPRLDQKVVGNENNTVRALYAAGGAEWNVSGSSFVKNRVDGNAGGAILLEDDTVLRIRNSTFAGNTFTAEAAANGARGAAIGYRHGGGAHLIVVHSTIAAPDVMPVGLVGSAIGGHDDGIAIDLSNSILRGSCGMNAHLLQNNAGNIESPDNTCGLDAEQNRANVSAASLALGALAGNGGATPTILPDAGSIAIDRGSTPQCLPVDQRGYARPGGLRCDVGAVEADADDTLFADGFDG